MNTKTTSQFAAHSRFNGTAAPKARRAKGAPKVAPTVTDVPFTETQDAHSAYRTAADNYMRHLKVPTLRRFLVSCLISIITSFTVYAGCLELVELVLLGAMTLTNSAFILVLIAVIGIFLSMVAAWITWTKTFNFVATFDVATAKAAAVAVKTRVIGWIPRRNRSAVPA